ncbi:MAG: hypothetical protein V4553_10145 [Bacteroidota bacterium]
MKKITLLVVLFYVVVITAKAQDLLGAAKNKIKKQMALQGGILAKDKITSDFVNPEPYNLLIYKYDEATMKKTDITLTIFKLKDKKCFEELVSYASEKHLKELVSLFNSTESSTGNSLMWVNKQKGYKISISKSTPNNTNYSPFILEMYKTGGAND